MLAHAPLAGSFGGIDLHVGEVPGRAEVGGEAPLVDGCRGVSALRVKGGIDTGSIRLDREIPGLADVVLIADEHLVLVDKALAALTVRGAENAGAVTDQVGAGFLGDEFLAEFEVGVPLANRGFEFGWLGGKARFFKHVDAVEECGGSDVDRDTELLTVFRGGLLPLPVEVVAFDVFRAELVEILEVVGLREEEGDVFTLDAGDVRKAGAGTEGGRELLLEVATDDILAEVDVGELFFDGLENVATVALGPVRARATGPRVSALAPRSERREISMENSVIRKA